MSSVYPCFVPWGYPHPVWGRRGWLILSWLGRSPGQDLGQDFGQDQWQDKRVPPGEDMGPEAGKGTWDQRLEYPPVDRHTPVETVPSRRTTYAGGNKLESTFNNISEYHVQNITIQPNSHILVEIICSHSLRVQFCCLLQTITVS